MKASGSTWKPPGLRRSLTTTTKRERGLAILKTLVNVLRPALGEGSRWPNEKTRRSHLEGRGNTSAQLGATFTLSFNILSGSPGTRVSATSVTPTVGAIATLLQYGHSDKPGHTNRHIQRLPLRGLAE